MHPAHGADEEDVWRVYPEIPATFKKEKGKKKLNFVMFNLDD